MVDDGEETVICGEISSSLTTTPKLTVPVTGRLTVAVTPKVMAVPCVPVADAAPGDRVS